MHPNRASPFAGNFSPQTRVSQGIPQWESILSVFIAETIAVSLASFDRKEIAHLGNIKIARFCGGAAKSPPQPQRIARFWCTQERSTRFSVRLSGHFPQISWNYVYVFSFFPKRNATYKQIWSPPISVTVLQSCLCLLVFFSPQCMLTITCIKTFIPSTGLQDPATEF